MKQVVEPMREAVLLALTLVWLGVACGTQVDVVVDESTDFSQLRTWAWLPPGASPEMGVDAPRIRNLRNIFMKKAIIQFWYILPE